MSSICRGGGLSLINLYSGKYDPYIAPKRKVSPLMRGRVVTNEKSTSPIILEGKGKNDSSIIHSRGLLVHT